MRPAWPLKIWNWPQKISLAFIVHVPHCAHMDNCGTLHYYTAELGGKTGNPRSISEGIFLGLLTKSCSRPSFTSNWNGPLPLTHMSLSCKVLKVDFVSGNYKAGNFPVRFVDFWVLKIHHIKRLELNRPTFSEILFFQLMSNSEEPFWSAKANSKVNQI